MIVIGFVSSRVGLFGKTIQIFTGCHINHCFLLNTDTNAVYEANFGGVKCFLLESKYYRGSRWRVEYKSHIMVSKSASNEMLKFLDSCVGKHYDYLQTVGVGVSMLLRRKHNLFNDDRLYNCSELVEQCFRKSGLVLTNKNINDVRPDDQYNSEYLERYDVKNWIL